MTERSPAEPLGGSECSRMSVIKALGMKHNDVCPLQSTSYGAMPAQFCSAFGSLAVYIRAVSQPCWWNCLVELLRFSSSVRRRARLEWPFMFFGACMKLHVSPTTSRPLTHAEWKLTRVAVALIDDGVRSAQRCSAAELRAVLLQCAQTASS